MFDYHISRFDKKVADLSDQPALSPSALKEWFDSSPEELRQALNHICDDGQVLSAKVEGLILGTFEGAVSKCESNQCIAVSRCQHFKRSR